MNTALSRNIPDQGKPFLGRRLLFVVNEATFFLSHRLCIARAAQERGFEVHVAVPPTPDYRKIFAEGFLVHSIPLARKGLNPFHDLRTCVSLFMLFRKIRPDVVHNVTTKPVLYGGIAARAANVPAVVSAISGLGYVFVGGERTRRMLRGLVLALYRVALAHPNSRVILQNEDDYTLFVRRKLVTKHQVTLIRGSGVDITLYTPRPEPSGIPVVILASRMLWDKGVGEFVEAATRLKKDGIRARFALVGDTDTGNPSAIKRKTLEELQNQGIVEWWGKCEDMPMVYASAHMVCLPSYREGLPKVLLEAAACGRPIISTDVPGCREIVEHGRNGLLVPAHNAIALAEALRVLIGDVGLRQKMGLEGRKMVEEEFSENLVVGKTLALYRELFLDNRVLERGASAQPVDIRRRSI